MIGECFGDRVSGYAVIEHRRRVVILSENYHEGGILPLEGIGIGG